MGVSKNSVFSPQIIHLFIGFSNKFSPSILGETPLFLETPIYNFVVAIPLPLQLPTGSAWGPALQTAGYRFRRFLWRGLLIADDQARRRLAAGWEVVGLGDPRVGYRHMGVSKNGGFPQQPWVFLLKMIILGWRLGVPPLKETTI